MKTSQPIASSGQTVMPSALKVRFYFIDKSIVCYVTIKGSTNSFRLPFQISGEKWDVNSRRFIGERADEQNERLNEILSQLSRIYRDLWLSGPVTSSQLIKTYTAEFEVKAPPIVPSEKETQILAEIESLRRNRPLNSKKRIALYEDRLDALKDRLAKLKQQGSFQVIEGLSEDKMRRLNKQVKLGKVMAVRFQLRHNTKAHSYKHDIQFVVRINGEDSAPQSTGISIKKSQWDARSFTVLGSEEDTLKLTAIKAGLERVFEEFKKRGKFPTPKTLIEHYFNNDLEFDKRVTLYDLMLLHLGDLKRRGRAIRTLQAYERTFLQFSTYSNIRSVGDVQKDDAKAFWEWLRKTRSNDYCNKSLERLRGFFDCAINHGIIEINPLKGMRFDWERKRDLTCLSKEEIEKLKNTPWSGPLQQTVDCFLFMLYTGMHIGDFNRLSSENIRTEQGMVFLEYTREKTSEVAIVPLHPIASGIIQKYGGPESMVKRSGKTTNQNLKIIAATIGTKKHLTNKIARKTFTDMSLNDRRMSEESVARMLGHTSTKFVKIYGQVAHRRILAEWRE